VFFLAWELQLHYIGRKVGAWLGYDRWHGICKGTKLEALSYAMSMPAELALYMH
jgi:hypothetical protein